MTERADRITLSEAAARSGVASSTLQRWVRERLVPIEAGEWTPAAAAQARVVARMRERGHSLRSIRAAVRDGRLAFGFVEDVLPDAGEGTSRLEAASIVGLDDELVERIMALLGVPLASSDRVSENDMEALRTIKRVLDSGFPLVALLQLIRIYAQSMRKIAEAEVRLFHLYVHEPMISDGLEALEIAEEMGGLAERLIPLMSPLTEYVHNRYLRHYVEQDVVGHMESDHGIDRRQAGEVAMSFCFVDLAGFTRFTEEAGDARALDMVEHFIETVETTLPPEATIVKTIGDEVMVVSAEPRVMVEWATGFLSLFHERPRPRTGLHFGRAVYRDGDYLGGDVNLAHRVAARALAGEVLATRSLVDEIGESRSLRFDPIGEVSLKGFPEPTELFVATRPGAE